MSTVAGAEPALRVEGLGPEAVADMIARIEELRHLLRDQREVLLDLVARSEYADHVVP